AGQRHRLDGEEFAANLGPGKTGDDADHVVGLGQAEAELAHAGELLEVAAGHGDPLALLHQDVLDRLAGQVGDLALEIADASLARVVAAEVSEGVLADAPLVLLEAV